MSLLRGNRVHKQAVHHDQRAPTDERSSDRLQNEVAIRRGSDIADSTFRSVGAGSDHRLVVQLRFELLTDGRTWLCSRYLGRNRSHRSRVVELGIEVDVGDQSPDRFRVLNLPPSMF